MNVKRQNIVITVVTLIVVLWLPEKKPQEARLEMPTLAKCITAAQDIGTDFSSDPVRLPNGSQLFVGCEIVPGPHKDAGATPETH
jgi:hypothetical protein